MSNLAATVLLLAALGLFFGYLNPTYRGVTGVAESAGKSVVELQTDRNRYEDALAKAREVEEARTGLLQAYNAIPAEQLKRLETLLPDSVDSVRFIIDINTLAASHSLVLKSVSLEETGNQNPKPLAKDTGTIGPKQKLAASVGLKFVVSGSYDDFRAFVRDLEGSLRLADPRKVEFSALQNGAYDFSVTIDTYRLE